MTNKPFGNNVTLSGVLVRIASNKSSAIYTDRSLEGMKTEKNVS